MKLPRCHKCKSHRLLYKKDRSIVFKNGVLVREGGVFVFFLCRVCKHNWRGSEKYWGWLF